MVRLLIEAPRRKQRGAEFVSSATSSDAALRNRGEVRSQCARRDSENPEDRKDLFQEINQMV